MIVCENKVRARSKNRRSADPEGTADPVGPAEIRESRTSLHN